MWRLKTAEVAYKVEHQKLEKAGIRSVSLFLNGNNIFLWSHLNEDRETGGVRDHDSHRSKYPITRRFNFGAKIEF